MPVVVAEVQVINSKVHQPEVVVRVVDAEDCGKVLTSRAVHPPEAVLWLAPNGGQLADFLVP